MLDYANIKFINKNIFNIKDYEIDKKYDNILLSNIYDYNNKLFRLKKFKKALNRYIDLLSIDGKILITYLHDIENKNGRRDRAVIYQKKSN